MNKENEEPNKTGAEETKQYFQTIQSDLGISGGVIGLYLNMHSHIITSHNEYPKNLVVNKNNLAPCGSETLYNYRKSTLPKISSDEIALHLTRGLDVCYTRQQYMDDLLSNKNITYNEKDGTIVETDDDATVSVTIDVDEFFEGACSTLSHIDDVFSKLYETKLRPGEDVSDEPEFTIAFGGIPCNMLEGIDAFLDKFRIRRETISPSQLTDLTSLFRKIEEGRIFTIDINILLYFFRDVFGATQVNIFDVGCAQMYYKKQRRFLSKADAVRVFEDNRRRNPRIGYGGKTKQNKRKKTKKTKKLKSLNRPH